MTKEEITKYEYCKEYLKCLDQWKDKLPFGIQKYGCGTGQPNIEYALENVHQEMYKTIRDIMEEVKVKVQAIIDKI